MKERALSCASALSFKFIHSLTEAPQKEAVNDLSFFLSFSSFHMRRTYVHNHYYYISVSGIPHIFTGIYSLSFSSIQTNSITFDSRLGSRYCLCRSSFSKMHLSGKEKSRTRLKKSLTFRVQKHLRQLYIV